MLIAAWKNSTLPREERPMKSLAVDRKAPSLKKPWIWSSDGRMLLCCAGSTDSDEACVSDGSCGAAGGAGAEAGGVGDAPMSVDDDGSGGLARSVGCAWAVVPVMQTTTLARILIVPPLMLQAAVSLKYVTAFRT